MTAGGDPSRRPGGLVLVTRPQPDADLFATALNDAGAAVLVAPLIHIDFETAYTVPGAPGGWAITSANGARALAHRRDIDRNLPAWCVGPASAAAARAAGLQVAGIAENSVESLAALIARAKPDGTVCHVTGSHRAGDLVGALAAAGVAAVTVQAYVAEAVTDLPGAARAAVASGRAVQVVLFSPRTARLFRRLAEAAGVGPAMAGMRHVCLSPAVAEALQEEGPMPAPGTVVVAPEPTAAAMIDIVMAGVT